MSEHPHRPALSGQTPPERRPAPDHLRQRIEAELDRTAGRRGTVVRVVAPIAAASLLAAGVVGAFQISDDAASPPADTPSTSPTPSPSPSPEPEELTEDVRPMTEAEITEQTAACETEMPNTGNAPAPDLPHQGEWKVQYAMVKDYAPFDEHSELVLSDDVGVLRCFDGTSGGWIRHSDASDRTPTEGRAGAESSLPGGTSTNCAPEEVELNTLISEHLFAVDDAVETVRGRLVVDGVQNPWVTTTPNRGHAVIRAASSSEQAHGDEAYVEVQLLDADGSALETEFYDQGDADRHLRTGTTAKTEVYTCTNMPNGPFGPNGRDQQQDAPAPPENDETGAAACRDDLPDAFDDETDRDYADWRVGTVHAGEGAWGAVLHDGEHVVGCSLFPTAEMGLPVADEPRTSEEAFHFALQATPDGDDALWAAGRVPDDVTEITYELPNGDAVDAVIDNGYWMVMYPGDQPMGSGDPSEWDPLRVTISATGGDTVHEIAFTPETMCNQSSHGC